MKEQLLPMIYSFVKTARYEPVSIQALPQLTSPLNISFARAGWQTLDTVTLNDPLFMGESENGYNLMSGIVNLINYVELQYASRKPVKTMLFLDKSARPAAYVLRMTYDYLEKHSGERGAEIASHRPEFRFINIGSGESDKHSDTMANEWMASLYRQEDLTGEGVLIVDEIIDSGSSVHRTGVELAKAGFSPDAPAISVFQKLPQWYGLREILGIGDVGKIYPATRDEIRIFRNKNPELFRQVLHAIHTYGWESVDDLMSPIARINTPKNIPGNVAMRLKALKNHTKYASEAVRYMASAGGFLGLRPDKKTLKKSYDFRQWLKLIIHESFERNLVQLASSPNEG